MSRGRPLCLPEYLLYSDAAIKIEHIIFMLFVHSWFLAHLPMVADKPPRTVSRYRLLCYHVLRPRGPVVHPPYLFAMDGKSRAVQSLSQ